MCPSYDFIIATRTSELISFCFLCVTLTQFIVHKIVHGGHVFQNHLQLLLKVLNLQIGATVASPRPTPL